MLDFLHLSMKTINYDTFNSCNSEFASSWKTKETCANTQTEMTDGCEVVIYISNYMLHG